MNNQTATRVLLPGMSGAGKSTLARELVARGFDAIDMDDNGWSRWINMQTGLPALRNIAGHEIVTTRPVEEVIEQVFRIVQPNLQGGTGAKNNF